MPPGMRRPTAAIATASCNCGGLRCGIAMARQPPDSSVALKVVWSSNANSVIVEEAKRYRADLVVGHSARRGVARYLLTYHDWHLIRELNQPLLLVKSSRPWKNRDIIVAIDPLHAHDKPAALDRRLLAAGRAFAGWAAGTLRAFHVHAPALTFLPGTALHPYRRWRHPLNSVGAIAPSAREYCG